jgi:hypothetical protein
VITRLPTRRHLDDAGLDVDRDVAGHRGLGGGGRSTVKRISVDV